MEKKLQVWRIGYYHSCSEWYPLGYVFAYSQEGALKQIKKEDIDGLGDCTAEEMKSIEQIAPLKIIKFLMKRGGGND